MQKIQELLDSQYARFNAEEYLHVYPDPLCIVKNFSAQPLISEIAFICACYSYGNAKAIVKNLTNMPLHLFTSQRHVHKDIAKTNDYQHNNSYNKDTAQALIKSIESLPLSNFPYYRFQTRFDTKICFLTLAHSIEYGGIYELFLQGYLQQYNVLEGIFSIQKTLERIILEKLQNSLQEYSLTYPATNSSRQLGFKGDSKIYPRSIQFLFGKKDSDSALKRYNMFLRWMVRKDRIDLGIWDRVSCSNLLLPVDTHTFRICKRIGLCQTRTANLKAVLEITNHLRKFDSNDPVKYDFALYRIGQLKDNILDKVAINDLWRLLRNNL
ncbi:TIGR02757 family protein [Helicobacter aurati]|uniref:TIGR02757 family protein n=1 Tax=Helicobacter aurati TaxID=137778 RepID=A0A3D8J4D8_9HELI|nr:TIGR02757 family protein [Helicobacter aurati]RDU72382.1 TIGR02757 family protein [Helicobacter aurati]